MAAVKTIPIYQDILQPFPDMVSLNFSHLKYLADHFRAGGITSALQNWEKLTSDSNIIGVVKYGLTLQFTSPPSLTPPHVYALNAADSVLVDSEIANLLRKGAICPTTIEKSDFFSPVFPRENKDGSPRLLLNLKKLNACVEHIHFKMETIQCVINMIQPNCWMASVDLKSAFYSIPVHPNHRKYLKFYWHNTPYVFNVMPNGYTDAPRMFTKLLKPIFAYLRSRGFCSVVFLDDSYLQGDTYDDCYRNVCHTLFILQNLGFTINPAKSVLLPTQSIEFLGYRIDSVTMTITLPTRKRDDIKDHCRQIIACPNPTIRDVARLIGKFVAASEAVPYAPLFYRTLEIEKARALSSHCGNFDKCMHLSPLALSDVSWWLNTLDHQYRSLLPLPVDQIIYCDASKQGWGAKCADDHTSGSWLREEWCTQHSCRSLFS